MSRVEDSATLFALLQDVETATVGHWLMEGFMKPSIQALKPTMKVIGPALTVALPEDDGTATILAISSARKGQVLVIDRMGDERFACFGAVTTAAAIEAGIAGVVIDGFVTDLLAIERSGLPVWCRGRSPMTTKVRQQGGSVGAEIVCGGVRVRPDDIVLADESGVLVLSPADARIVAERALAMQAGEPEIIARLRTGERFDAILGIAG